MSSRVMVLNGANLGLLGRREPDVYGTTTHDDLVRACEQAATELGWTAEVRQTDDEAVLLGWLHEAADGDVPVVLNPGAWSHYSYALRDAATLVPLVVEVHLSQTAAREDFRHTSVVSPVVAGTVTGLGVEGYRAAIRAIVRRRSP